MACEINRQNMRNSENISHVALDTMRKQLQIMIRTVEVIKTLINYGGRWLPSKKSNLLLLFFIRLPFFALFWFLFYYFIIIIK